MPGRICDKECDLERVIGAIEASRDHHGKQIETVFKELKSLNASSVAQDVRLDDHERRLTKGESLILKAVAAALLLAGSGVGVSEIVEAFLK